MRIYMKKDNVEAHICVSRLAFARHFAIPINKCKFVKKINDAV
jgi:hypothetical protein